MQNKTISIRNANTHNLKNVDIDIPRHKLIVITGLSGSGKSSLAFDTIYAEGQRRYMESLSSYAKQYIDLMDKPDVSSITGLTPTIAIDQKSGSNNPRSTVGTATEIYDLLRLLFARIGVPHCPKSGQPMTKQTIEDIVTDIIKQSNAQTVLAPLVKNKVISDKKVIQQINKAGYTHVRFDGQVVNIANTSLNIDEQKHTLEIVLAHDKFTSKFELRKIVKKALDLSNGFVTTCWNGDGKLREKNYSTIWTCLDTNFTLEDLEPKHFSFNSPQGACSACHGLGVKLKVNSETLLNKKLSINEGAIRAWPKNNSLFASYLQSLAGLAKKKGFSMDTPTSNLSHEQLNIVLYGEKNFPGIANIIEKRYSETESATIKSDLEQYMQITRCPDCGGKRLKPEYLAVTVAGISIAECNARSIDSATELLDKMVKKLPNRDTTVAKPIVQEITYRLNALTQAGLNYVTLERPMNTLSGGESQRVKLATQLSSNLVNVTYILDEPSVGLHPRDIAQLIKTLKKLRDLENTVIVVEHDEAMMKEADFLIDVGPGAGRYGGEIIAAGTPQQIINNQKSLTGQYLAKRKKIEVVGKPRAGNDKFLKIVSATEHNLKNISVKIPLGKFIAFTGVSGSGKSTLMTDILSKALHKHFFRAQDLPGEHKKIEGLEHIDKVITIDQSPIGRTPRSNPATYTGAFTYIRDLFAEQPESQIHNLNAGHFSFNVVGGRCETCSGDGYTKIDMQFLSDVYVKCKTCGGRRYQKDILDIYYLPPAGQDAKNIAEVLDMTVIEAKEFFRGHEVILQKLSILDEVGLGYIKLGQSATTLSGGEAQRVKLATELSRRETGKTLYILDEPTTGLHFDDIKKLLNILNKLTDKGNTVLIIEHNLDVIKSVDHIIDLGPDGGDKGGYIVAEGTPLEVAKVKKSYTGQYLKKML
ncbi:MAG: excinuclease ABC subunit UvrA [bacterium]|nr:excinuclease ABC subunit UvrA [bacterium]